ncbi:MAG: lipid-binding protein [Bacteroidetes bacterium]|jgi:ribosome-associated toxin RatA of RatAB toxin-antitoxin module|nr:lipid-binding protein [Bacteroidota bacterium]
MHYKKLTFWQRNFFFFFFLLCKYSSSQSQNDWILKKEEEGISVYTRNVETSSLKELKSVVTIRTSLSSIVALLNDWDSYPQWVYRCEKSSTLKTISESEVIHYQTVIAPWPVDSRDFVVNVKLTQDPITKIITIISQPHPDFIPKTEDMVRIRNFKASWTLIPLKDGWVEVNYQLLVDPGGYVPAWLVNLAVVEGPYQTKLNMKKWVMKDKYQKAVISYLKE